MRSRRAFWRVLVRWNGRVAIRNWHFSVPATNAIEMVRPTQLQNAASIAGLLLTTEAMVADAPKEDAPAAMPDMGGMGGMGGMM